MTPQNLLCIALLLLVSITQPALAGGAVLEGRVEIVDASGAPMEDLSGVVVFVDELPDPSPQQQVPQISHLNLQFNPTVLPVKVGDQVDFLNDDSIYHNAFSLSRAKPFDLGIYPRGSSKLVTFDQPGLVKVFCQIHPNMISNILVLNNRLHAVTDPQGNYRIKGVPAGLRNVRTWHELSNGVSQEIKVTGSGVTNLNLRLVANKERVQHKNKFGQPYRKKY